MNQTEELRTGLDERGIEHYDHEDGEPLRDLSEAGADPATSWRMGGASVCAVPNKHGTFDLWIDNCTAEQIIAMTAGAGTCKVVIEKRRNPHPWIHHYDCGYDFYQWPDCPMPVQKHCPNCGRRIEVKQ